MLSSGYVMIDLTRSLYAPSNELGRSKHTSEGKAVLYC